MGAPKMCHIISGQHDIILQGLADLWHRPSGREMQESQLLTCCWLAVYWSTTLRFCFVTCSGTAVISSPCKPQELHDHIVVVANSVRRTCSPSPWRPLVSLLVLALLKPGSSGPSRVSLSHTVLPSTWRIQRPVSFLCVPLPTVLSLS